MQAGGTLTLGLSTDPVSVQPRGGGAGNDQLYVARQLFDSLLEQDPATGKLIPWLAESYDVSDDATTFTFHLRDDVTFSDGTPLTAQVVKDNFDDVVASGAKATWVISYFATYDSSAVVDDHTVTVTFKSPNASFPQAVATSGMGIVGEATLKVPFEDRATGNLIGTGPFTLKSYAPASEIVLVKRPGYAWAPSDRANQGDAHLDEIDFKVIPEASVRTGSLQSGQVAAIGGVPPQDIATLRDGKFEIVARPNPGVVFGLSAVQDHAAARRRRRPPGDRRGDRHDRGARHRAQRRLRRRQERVVADDPRLRRRAGTDRLRHGQGQQPARRCRVDQGQATACAPRTARSCTSCSAG